MKLRMTTVTVIALMFVFGGISHADILGPNCPNNSCQGSRYLLAFNPTALSPGLYDVFLAIETVGYNGGGNYIDAVAFKIASQYDFGGSLLVAAPGGASKWTLKNGGIAAGGCKAVPNGNGYLCAQDGQTAPVPSGTIYVWEFHYATSATITDGETSSIKAEYVDGNGNKVGALVSEDITLQSCGSCGDVITPFGTVPEPASIVLFGSLLGFTTLALRKKFRKA